MNIRLPSQELQVNSALYKRRFQMGINPNVDHRLLRPLGPFAI